MQLVHGWCIVKDHKSMWLQRGATHILSSLCSVTSKKEFSVIYDRCFHARILSLKALSAIGTLISSSSPQEYIYNSTGVGEKEEDSFTPTHRKKHNKLSAQSHTRTHSHTHKHKHTEQSQAESRITCYNEKNAS